MQLLLNYLKGPHSLLNIGIELIRQDINKCCRVPSPKMHATSGLFTDQLNKAEWTAVIVLQLYILG